MTLPQKTSELERILSPYRLPDGSINIKALRSDLGLDQPGHSNAAHRELSEHLIAVAETHNTQITTEPAPVSKSTWLVRMAVVFVSMVVSRVAG